MKSNFTMDYGADQQAIGPDPTKHAISFYITVVRVIKI